MKLVLFIFALLTSLLIFDNQAWSAPIFDTHNKTMLREIRNIATKCTLAERNKDLEVIRYLSQCPIFTIDALDTAHVFIGKEWYTVVIVPSVLADGDDLSDMNVYDDNGRLVAQKKDVLSFGNILAAMSGQDLLN